MCRRFRRTFAVRYAGGGLPSDWIENGTVAGSTGPFGQNPATSRRYGAGEWPSG